MAHKGAIMLPTDQYASSSACTKDKQSCVCVCVLQPRNMKDYECVWYCGSGCGCGLKKVVL